MSSTKTRSSARVRTRLSDRLPGRRARASLDVAQTNRHNENHWAAADALSANAAYLPEVRRTVRNRARYEVANNTYAAGMVRTLAYDTIGVGPSLQVLARTKDQASQVEWAYWKWCVAVRKAEKLRIMRMGVTRDGESFARFTTNLALRDPVKLDLRLYEPEQIAAPMLGLPGDPGLLTDGVFTDDFGNVVGYSVLRQHPGDTLGWLALTDPETVPARDMVHLFRAERAGQARGVPEIYPALPLYAQLRRYTLAVIASAEEAANVGGVMRSQQNAGDPDDIEPLDELTIERRTMLTLPRGWDLTQFKAEQPTTTYQMFKREIVAEIARCLGMPYNVAAGDSSSYNYASGRLDHKTYFKWIRVDRSHIELAVLDPIFARWWEEARLVRGLLPAELAASREPPEHEWRWDGDEHVDPLKEASAQQTRLANHTTTLAREYGRAGLDWETELRQRAKELELMNDLRIPLPVAPGQPAPAGLVGGPLDNGDYDEDGAEPFGDEELERAAA